MDGLEILLFISISLCSEDPIVEIQQGKLRGSVFTSSRSQHQYFGFTGIPYAKAPLGNLRFEAPQSADPWTGVWDATSERNSSIQISFVNRVFQGNKDCLYINIHTPQLPTLSRDLAPMPVMVYYHCGGFTFGSGNRKLQGRDYLELFLSLSITAWAPFGKSDSGAPQPAEPWTGVRDATQERDVCVQMSFMNPVLEGKEDCLFLNVYTPEVPGSAKNANLMPVMVWIHGDGFAWGSGNRKLQGPDFFMDETIVFVSLNYRLGAFGFLSLENKEAPGNAGLKDQVMALRWLRDNIKQFGGDPDDVTIFGQGSGAACVHYHMLSPVSEGLFHKAISQSGSVLCPWAYTRSARRVAFQLGALLGKNTTDDVALLDYLRGVAPEEIAEAAATRQDLVPPPEERDPLGFSPRFVPTKEVVYEDGEEVFLPGEPRELILEGKFEQVPHLVGSCSQDGYIIYHASQMAGVSLQHLNDEPSDLVLPGMQQTNGGGDKPGVGRSIKSFYFGYSNISNETLPQFVKMTTDLYFEFPAHETVKLQAVLSTSPIYFYQFAFDAQYGEQELAYLFPNESLASLNLSLADAEVQTSYDLVKMWTDFAKTGNPTPDDQLNIKWLPYNNEDHNCLLIDRGLTLAKDVHKDRMDFCQGLYAR